MSVAARNWGRQLHDRLQTCQIGLDGAGQCPPWRRWCRAGGGMAHQCHPRARRGIAKARLSTAYRACSARLSQPQPFGAGAE